MRTVEHGSIAAGLCMVLAAFTGGTCHAQEALSEQLCDAAESGTPAQVADLVKRGADPNGACREDSGGDDIPIVAATGSGRLDNVTALLNAGANINATAEAGTDEDDTVLFFAPTAEVAKFLIAHGAKVNYQNSYGATALSRLAYLSNSNVPKMSDELAVAAVLIDNGADVNNAGVAGRTVVMEIGALGGDTDASPLLELLIARGADVNKKNDDGHTALGNLLATAANPIYADEKTYLALLKKYEAILVAHGAVK